MRKLRLKTDLRHRVFIMNVFFSCFQEKKICPDGKALLTSQEGRILEHSGSHLGLVPK